MIDAHVHLFPDRLFDAIWRWFDENAWTIRRKLYADGVCDELERAGCDRAVGLLYAHKPGISEQLNAWIGALARRRPLVVPCATAHPRDADVRGLLRRAKEVHGARIVKQHCHVIHTAPDDPVLFPIYEACIELDLPLNLHVGNGPKLAGYAAPTDAVSGAARTLAVLERYPELRLVVPHLGSSEEPVFFAWLDRFPNLVLDTAMAMVPFLPGMAVGDRSGIARHPGRVMFGSDFPNIPYELETERAALGSLGLDEGVLDLVMHGTAGRVLGLAGGVGEGKG